MNLDATLLKFQARESKRWFQIEKIFLNVDFSGDYFRLRRIMVENLWKFLSWNNYPQKLFEWKIYRWTTHEDIRITSREKFTLKILILMKVSLVKHIIDQGWINKIFSKQTAKHNSLIFFFKRKIFSRDEIHPQIFFHVLNAHTILLKKKSY